MRFKVTIAAFVLALLAALPTNTFAATNLALDAAALTQLEQRAEHAIPREQCFLYTELVEIYTDAAARQLAAGEIEQASASLKRVQTFAERIHMGLANDSKRLKNAEMRVHAASFRLGQFLREVSSEDKPIVESTLKQLEKVHDELLAQVFAH